MLYFPLDKFAEVFTSHPPHHGDSPTGGARPDTLQRQTAHADNNATVAHADKSPSFLISLRRDAGREMEDGRVDRWGKKEGCWLAPWRGKEKKTHFWDPCRLSPQWKFFSNTLLLLCRYCQTDANTLTNIDYTNHGWMNVSNVWKRTAREYFFTWKSDSGTEIQITI